MAKESEITISPSTSAGTYPRGFSFKKSTQHNMVLKENSTFNTRLNTRIGNKE
jgi:hypothetical protein